MRTLAIILVLASGIAWGQPKATPSSRPATGTPGGTLPELTFPTLDGLDRRENLARIREQILFQNQAHQQRLKEANDIYAAMGRLPKIVGVDPCILAGIEIQRDLVVTLDGIREDRERCLKILELLDDAARDPNVSTEAARYLKDARQAATNMLRFQLAQKKRLAATATTLKNMLQRLPPPGTFENGLGMPMVLVRQKKDSFYISQTPVSAEMLAKAFRTEGVAANWHQANQFCQWLSDTTSAPYLLPTLDQMRVFVELGGKVPGPVWTRDLHAPKAPEERRMRSRFGVELVMLFDPARVLGDQVEREEVPFASYPEISFYVVTAVDTGWWFRWHTLKQTLDN